MQRARFFPLSTFLFRSSVDCLHSQTRVLAPPCTVLLFKRHFDVRWRSSPLLQFLKRTQAAKKIWDLLHERTWDEDTPAALNRLDVNLVSYVACEVLRSSIRLETAVNFYNWLTTKDGFEPDSYVYNALMCRFGQAGRLLELETVVKDCEADGKATVVTFTTLIAAYSRVGNIEAAVRTLEHMEEIGLKPNMITYTTMIDLFAKQKMYDKAGDYYLQLLQEGHIPNVRTCTVLIKHLVEADKLDGALAIFEQSVKVSVNPNPVTYTILMIGYARAGDLGTVLNLARKFNEYSSKPRPFGASLSPLFKFLLREGRIEDTERIMTEAWPESSPDNRREHILKLQSALEVEETYVNRDGAVFPVAADGFASDSEEENSSSNVQSAVDPLTRLNMAAFVRSLIPWTAATSELLKRAKIKWDGEMVSEILKRLSKADVAWKLFNWVKGQPGFSHDNYTYSRMIQILLTAGHFKRVRLLLQEAQRDGLNLPLHTYNNIIKFCGLKQEADVALEVFDCISHAGLKPDESTYKSLIHALHKCDCHWRASTIFSKMQRAGFHADAKIYSFLINGFTAAGELKMAKAVYKQMCASGVEPNEHVYKAAISTLYRTGNLVRAKQVFQRMRRAGVIPSESVYKLMIKVFDATDEPLEAQKLEDESKALVPQKATGKKWDLDQFMNFHTIFIKNLTNNDKAQSLAVG